MKTTSRPEVKRKFTSYPVKARARLLELKELIISTAEQIESIHEIEESLKWGEPSYLVKKGSTIRIDWKERKPEKIAIYFKCTSKLVPTFKALFGKELNFEGNRAIQFGLDEEFPEEKLRICISLALQYHDLKHLPLLGLKKPL